MRIALPELCLILLAGPSGSGKSTFARTHFLASEVVSSDACRAAVADDPNDQTATGDAFDLLHQIVALRLKRGRLTVVDATNVRPEDRASLVALAREHDVLSAIIALDLPERVCHDRNASRPDRAFAKHVVRNQLVALRRGLRGLSKEGFRYAYTLTTPEQVAGVRIERQRLWTDRRDDAGPFDIIGDIHGCYDELVELLNALDYDTTNPDRIVPPPGRKVVFLGDLVDRGPDSPGVLWLVMQMVEQGKALCVPGNHDVKLLRKLIGKSVALTHGLDKTMEQLGDLPEHHRESIAQFISSLVSHHVLDGGRLVVAHAGMKEGYIGRASGRVREFALYGETTGESDDLGLPVRLDWAADYRGEAAVIYGHTPVYEPVWHNNTLNVDTGCVFGGRLTALRWPEREVVSVAARQTYAEPARPLKPAEAAPDDLLDLADVTGKRFVQTSLQHSVTIRAENAAAALETMARFAVDPRWLIYLPPTMAPPPASTRDGLLEHPADAFEHYRGRGVNEVVCQAKHMGSRAVVIACRDADIAKKRFGVDDELAANAGVVYTRTGRPFFDDATEGELLSRVRGAVEKAGLWDELETDWLLLDCEVMPWSAKARELIRTQYAAVASVASGTLDAAVGALNQATGRTDDADLAALLARTANRRDQIEQYTRAYQHYNWPVAGVADLRLAPFHLLAAEGRVFADRDHDWHLTTLARLAEHDDVLTKTETIRVDLSDAASEAAATDWWERYTADGGEGIVVKPASFVTRGDKGLVQPATKVRGREYLRIIYGPTYTDHLDRLRQRSLGAKRSLALREFALGIEGLQRFVDRRPLRQVHECAFAVLALESEPVDARL